MATFGNTNQEELYEEIRWKAETHGLLTVLEWPMEIIGYLLKSMVD